MGACGLSGIQGYTGESNGKANGKYMEPGFF